MAEPQVYKRVTTLTIILIAICILAIGVGTLLIAELLIEHLAWQAVIRNIGGVLVAIGVIAILWELLAKRAFLSEIMVTTRLAENIRLIGLKEVVFDFQRGIDWPSLFKTVKKLDIFFTYGRSWRGSNQEALRCLAQRGGVRVRVVLPDPDNKQIVGELARRFNRKSSEVKREIKDAVKDFQSIFGGCSQSDVEFSLWYLPQAPVFSFYFFDNIGILALYRHRPERGEVPIFRVEEGGTLYGYLRKEFNAFVHKPNPLARRIIPEE